MFIGLPCHVESLRKYCKIKKVDTKTLIAVDIVCHGMTSEYYFINHLKHIGIQKGCDIYFRKKNNDYGLTIILGGREVYRKSAFQDNYMRLYHHNIFLEACYSCPFAQKNRVGDISIKDCNNRFKYISSRYHDQSSVLINTVRGDNFWNDLSTNGNLISYRYSADRIISEDKMLQTPPQIPQGTGLLYLLEKKIGWENAIDIMSCLWNANKAIINRIKKWKK